MEQNPPISYTVTISFSNRDDMVYTSPDKEDALRFKSTFKKGKTLQPSGSIVRDTKLVTNYLAITMYKFEQYCKSLNIIKNTDNAFPIETTISFWVPSLVKPTPELRKRFSRVTKSKSPIETVIYFYHLNKKDAYNEVLTKSFFIYKNIIK